MPEPTNGSTGASSASAGADTTGVTMPDNGIPTGLNFASYLTADNGGASGGDDDIVIDGDDGLGTADLANQAGDDASTGGNEGAQAKKSASDESKQGKDGSEPAKTDAELLADAIESDDPGNLPAHLHDRFRQVVGQKNAEKQGREAAEARLRELEQQQQSLNPLLTFLQQQGYQTPEAFMAAAQQQQQQAEDAAYANQQREKYEAELFDAETVERLVQQDLQVQRTMREAEGLRAQLKADSDRIAAQRREHEITTSLETVYQAQPVLRDFAKDANGRGLGERFLNELRQSGNTDRYTPENLKLIAEHLAGEFNTALEAARNKAATDAVAALEATRKQSPKVLQSGGGDPPATQANNEYKTTGNFAALLRSG